MGTPNIRPPASLYEEMLDEVVEYFTFAERFGWTSEQVDNERAWILDRFPLVFSALAEVKERRGRQ